MSERGANLERASEQGRVLEERPARADLSGSIACAVCDSGMMQFDRIQEALVCLACGTVRRFGRARFA